MRKGYALVILFALFTAVSRTWYYRAYVAKDVNDRPLMVLALQSLLMFLIILIPGLLLTRWYYKKKDAVITTSEHRQNPEL